MRLARDALGYDHPSGGSGGRLPYFDTLTINGAESTYLTIVINSKYTRRVRAGQVAVYDRELLGPIYWYTVDAGANLSSGDFEILEVGGTPLEQKTEFQQAGVAF